MLNNSQIKPKILVVLGPTATGKSNLAVKLAKKFHGEIISADSRQVYQGMDLGSGKITKKEMLSIPHHLLDVTKPKNIFSVGRFKKLAEKKIQEIVERNHLPIICGGTGFYIDTLVQGLQYPEVKINKKLREKLEKLSLEKLIEILKKLDPNRAKNIDSKNKVRLIRAIEIAKSLGKVPKVESRQLYDPIYIGLDLSDLELKQHIAIRLETRLKAGMVREVACLHQQGVSYRRLESFGLEYKNCALFLQNKISRKQLSENILKESFQFAKRQRTWFKRNKKIRWFNPKQKANIKIIEKEIQKFLAFGN